MKVITEQERDFLIQLLPYYWRHIQKNPDTLLPRYYGVYSMKHEGIGGVTRFLVTNNLYNTPYDPVEKYALKGCTVGKAVPIKQRKEGIILKDIDMKESGRKLYFLKPEMIKFAKQLKKDTSFLEVHNIMDFSLLLGIYFENDENAQRTLDNINLLKKSKSIIPTLYQTYFQKTSNGIACTRPDGVKEIYYFGIVDVLAQFQNMKKAQNIFRSVLNMDEGSVVHPKYYSQRFFNFVCELLAGYDASVLGNDSDEEEQVPAIGVAKRVTKL